MSSGNASFRSHEEGIPRHPAFAGSFVRRRARRKKARWLSAFFYALLVLLNLAVLSLFGPGGIADDLLRIFSGAQETVRGAQTPPPAAQGQFPPGENWDNRAEATVRPTTGER
ncbi:MAG: hypothetical protein ABIH26_04795 [Candidatus Eisenbacteria bacterium]